MGKGTILSHQADGKYSVNLNFYTGDMEARKEALQSTIDALTTRITELEAIDAGTGDLYITINIAKLQKLSVQKKLNSYNSIPETESTTAWCADLTETLAGDVGTIEIPGETTDVMIQPGQNFEGETFSEETITAAISEIESEIESVQELIYNIW